MKKLLAGLAIISATVLAGCGMQNANNTANGETQTVKVGMIAPLSGPAATYGEDAIRAYQLAAEEFNNSQNDYMIEIIAEDGKCNGQDATAAAQKLVNIDQVKVILGGLCSAETLAAMKVTEPAKVVLVSAASSNPDISNADDYVYRYFNDLLQGKALTEHLEKIGATNVALLYENTDYSVGLANVIKDNKGDMNIYEERFAAEEKDFPAIASRVASRSEVDAIVYIPSSEGNVVSLLRALDDEGLLEKLKGSVLTSEVGLPNSALETLGSMTDGILTTQLVDYTTLGDESIRFIDKFKSKYTVNLTDTYIALYKETFDMAVDWITDSEYGINDMNAYMHSINEQNPREGLGKQYYFDGVDAVNALGFVMKRAENGTLVDNE